MAMTLTSIILPRWISWNSEILNEKVMSPLPPLSHSPLSLSKHTQCASGGAQPETNQKDYYKLTTKLKP